MPILTNLNRKPYFDDFDRNDNYYQVLSKPGFPLQARELNNLQSILGNQIEELGSVFFSNGDQVTKGGYQVSIPTAYVRLASITQGSKAADYIGYELTGVVSGVRAEVIFAEDLTEDSDTVFFVNYIDSGVDGEYDTFIEGETLETNTPNFFTATVGVTTKSKPVDTPVVGFGSLFTVEEGSMWVNGKIVRVEKQTISLCKYSTKPSFVVGLIVDEDFVTVNEDPSLADNAQGHTNFAAPGADRLKISLRLTKKADDSDLPNFIKLTTVLQGNIVGDDSAGVKWEWLMDLLARRTYDESGNYTLTEFPVKPMSYWNSLPENLKDFYFTINDEEVDGVFEPEPEIYGVDTPYPPVPGTITYQTPTIEDDKGCGYDPNRGANGDPLTFLQADAKYSVLISPGEAYVQGYRVGYKSPFYVFGDKPRTKYLEPDTRTQINPGSYVIVNNVYNAPNVANIDNVVKTRAFDAISTYRNFTDGHTGGSFKIETLDNSLNSTGERGVYDKKPQNLGNKPWTTYHLICNSSVEIKYEQMYDKDGNFIGFKDAVVNIDVDGRKVPTRLVYPDPNINAEKLTGYLQTDSRPTIFDLNWEDNEGSQPDSGKLMVEGTDTSYSLSSTNSIVVALDPSISSSEDYLNTIIKRGDAVDGATGLVGDARPRVLVAQRIDPILSGVVHPKYYYPNTLVNKSDSGFFGYNSSYNMGVMSSILFTDLIVVDDPTPSSLREPWRVAGMDPTSPEGMIVGATSKAVGKLEQVRENVLVVSSVFGKFLPGEQVYQPIQGGGEEIIQALLSEVPEEMFTDVVSGVIERLILDNGDNIRAPFKKGRIIREGEVISMKFNSRLGGAGEVGWGGGDKELANNLFLQMLNVVLPNEEGPVYTNDVLLTNPTTGNRNMRLPEEAGFETQEDFNNWIYWSIYMLDKGIAANNTFVNSDAPPDVDVAEGDLWLNTENYSLYVRTHSQKENGDIVKYWIAVTPSDGDDFTGAVPQAVVQLAEEIQAMALNTNSTFDTESSVEDYDLSKMNKLMVYANGSTIDLEMGEGKDYTWDSAKNTLEFTQKGRDRVYKFSFFNPDRGVDQPRVNYELLAYRDTGKGGPYQAVRGYATSSPAIINNTMKKTKAFHSLGHSQSGDETNPMYDDQFSADANLTAAESSEVYDLANGALFSGSMGLNFLTCDNFSGDASNDLIAGDLIAFANDRGRFEYKIVSHVTKPNGYGAKKTKCTIYFTTTILSPVTGKVVQRLRLKNFGKSTESLIYQLPVSPVSSLETNFNVTDINYNVFREYVTDQIQNSNVGDASSITFSTDQSNATFISDSLRCTLMIVSDNNPDSNFDGRSLALNQIVPIEITDGGRTITLNLNTKLASNVLVKAILPVRITNAKSKRKKIIRDVYTYISKENTEGQKVFNLGYADVYRLQSVEMKVGDDEWKDVTFDYTFDDGQRDTYYDYSRIFLNTGRPTPSDEIRIKFDYFKHEGADGQDFFSVDSYTHDEGVPYGDIPVYLPQNTFSENQTTDDNKNFYIKLRDCVDYRPIINTFDKLSQASDTPEGTPSGDVMSDYSIPSSEIFNFYNEKVGGDAFAPEIPIPTTQFESDIEYYLPKIDSLFLDKSGKMILKEGEPSPNPVKPDDIPTGIRLYDLFLPAYTFDIDDIVIKKYNYRRYTMKDIMDIDKRVERVEDLVSLTILEQSALNMSVRDAVTGLDRFKNGIVVDPFMDHSRGDVGALQYRCSIDPKESHLRPPFVSNQVHLEEAYQTDEERSKLGGYQKSNNIVTVPYIVEDYIVQSMATRSIDVQKTTSNTFEGVISLSPAMDTFYDTTKPPKLIIDSSNIYDAALKLTSAQKDVSMGTVWTEWETTGGLANDRVNQFGIEFNNKQLSPVDSASLEYTSGTIELANNSLAVNKARNYTRSGHSSSTTTTDETSFGKRVADIQLSRTMRSIPVYFTARRLKPNTRYYAFFDDVNVSEWICVDKIFENYTDQQKRYNGAPGSEPLGFNKPLMSDSDGNISGVFIIPNGRSPVEGSLFTGSMDDIEYNKTGKSRTFSTGSRSFKLSSSPSTSANATDITGYAKTDFISNAVIRDKTENIVSTRQVEYTTNTTLNEDVRFNYDGTGSATGSDYNPSGVPAPSTIPYDPLAQTFIVDRNYPEGVFVKELDLYFRDKDLTQGVEAYLVSTEGGVPTNKIVPHSRVVMPSNTTLRIICGLRKSVERTSLAAGTVVRGKTSKATGTLKNDVEFVSSNISSTTNVENTVYNVIVSNYLGEFLPGEELEIDVNPANVNNFRIASDEYTITRIDLTNMGEKYTTAPTVLVSQPQLPGGVTATAEAVVAKVGGENGVDGQVYEINLLNSGSGYTQVPTITINGTGSGATAIARVEDGVKAVTMGVSTSDDAMAATKFKFKAPVYLMGNKTYAFVVKSPTSMKYKLWCSKMGETVIGSLKQVTRQPNMGVVFTSQNAGMWTEDQSLDIKFNLRRSRFSTNVDLGSALRMNNSPYTFRKLPRNPISTWVAGQGETDSSTSTDFGYNSKVVKLTHYNHGLVEGDLVVLNGVQENPGGIPNSDLNGLHKVLRADLDEFTIMVESSASTAVQSGGVEVTSTYNKPYETINLYAGAMTFDGSKLTATNRSIQYPGIKSVPVVSETPTTYSVTHKGYNEENGYTLDDAVNIPIMDTHYYAGAKNVAHYMNELNYADDEHLRRQRSVRTEMMFATTDDRVSPIIDLDRTNLTIVHNMVDKQPDYSVISGSGIDANAETAPVSVVAGQPTEVSPETFNRGSNYAKWVSKMFVFDNECDGIEVKLSAIFYELDDIKVYYKTRNVGLNDDFSKVLWEPFNPKSIKPNEKQKAIDVETEAGGVTNYTYQRNNFKFTPGLSDNIDVNKVRNSLNVDPRNILSSEWQELTYSVQDLPKFDAVAIKIVMSASNSALVPLIDDFRLCASE